MLRSLFTIGMLSLLIQNCGWIESSEYDPGNYDPKNGESQARKPKPTDPPEEPNLVKDCTKEFKASPGLPACVAQYLKNECIVAFDPPALAAVASIDTYDQFLNATDTVLRAIVDDRGLIDYDQLNTTYAGTWAKILAYLAEAPAPSNTNDDAQITFWINAYNILMLEFVREELAANPDAEFVPEVFDTGRRVVGRDNISLNDIERGILRVIDGSLRDDLQDLEANVKEPLVHVALVCGAISCPKLRNFVYRPDQLDIILFENMLTFMNTNQHVATEGSKLKLNQLLDWYTEDFELIGEGSFTGLGKFAVTSCRDDSAIIQSALKSWDESKPGIPDEIEFIRYLWDINQQ